MSFAQIVKLAAAPMILAAVAAVLCYVAAGNSLATTQWPDTMLQTGFREK